MELVLCFSKLELKWVLNETSKPNWCYFGCWFW